MALSVSSHALSRYRIHKQEAEASDVVNAVLFGEELDKDLTAAITCNPRRKTHQGRFVLSKGVVGWGIWVIDNEDTIRTYLRLDSMQKQILGGDQGHPPGTFDGMELPEGARKIRRYPSANPAMEFYLGEYLVVISKASARGPTAWSWSIKTDQHAKGIAGGWADREIALKMLDMVIKELQSERR